MQQKGGIIYALHSYKKRTRDCTAHFIRAGLLTEGVTGNLRKVTSYAARHEVRLIKLLTGHTEDGSRNSFYPFIKTVCRNRKFGKEGCQ